MIKGGINVRTIFIVFILIILSGCVPQPEIQIQRIEEGKTYATDLTIQIDEEAAGKYAMKLNGQEIQNGYKVTENGEYKLSITAKRWWNEKTKTIQFSRDSNPPLPPAFYPEIKAIYFQQVNFKLVKLDGVIYTATIDGKPFNLNESYKEEGSHKLKVIAVKDNGLSSRSEFDFRIDNRTYSKGIIDEFIQFYFDEDKKVQNILKWTDSVEVFVHGNLTSVDYDVVNSIYKKINEMLPIDFTIIENEKDSQLTNRVDIYFVPTYKFKDYGFEGEIIENNIKIIGFANPTSYSSDGITGSQVLIGTDTKQTERKTIILHEIVHSLGLYNHLEDKKTSILYPYANTNVYELSNLDEKFIEILYREDIKPKMSKREIEWALEPWITE